MNRFVEDNIRLIPVWLGVTRSEVSQLNPALADLVSIRATTDTVDSCALEILRTVRPQLYENLSMLNQLDSAKFSLVSQPRHTVKLKRGPIRHHDLPDSLLVRIRIIWFAIRDLTKMSLEKMIENFQRDLRPEREVQIWERIISAVQIAMDIIRTDAPETRQQVFKVIMSFSIGGHERVFEETKAGRFNKAIVSAAAKGWLTAVPPVTISDVEDKGL